MVQANQQDNDRYKRLCERIVERCRQQNWYGSDYERPKYKRYENYCEPSHDLETHFQFPPATEEQLRLTEAEMGFEYPPFLRALYLYVANGGFGPYSGLTGVPGGFSDWVPLVSSDPRYVAMEKERLVKEYGEAFCLAVYPELFDPIPFDLEQHEEKYDHPREFTLSRREWPTYFLHLCEWAEMGESDEVFLHVRSGHLYLVSWEFGGEATLRGDEVSTRLYRIDGSLEDWFERWLDDIPPVQWYQK